MRLQLFRHLWGVTGSNEEVFPKFKELGFHGIESQLPPPATREGFRALLDQHGFDYIAQIFTSGNNVAEHVASFHRQIEEAKPLRPRFINAHSGRDAWDESESALFFGEALAVEADAGLPVAHETHRGRILFNPWIAHRLLARFDTLKLCCDMVCPMRRNTRRARILTMPTRMVMAYAMAMR